MAISKYGIGQRVVGVGDGYYTGKKGTVLKNEYPTHEKRPAVLVEWEVLPNNPSWIWDDFVQAGEEVSPIPKSLHYSLSI